LLKDTDNHVDDLRGILEEHEYFRNEEWTDKQ
jgi:hypothetical protein